jgi:hypothetical protein
MHRRMLTAFVCAMLSGVLPALAQARPDSAKTRIGFWVIGPSEQTRGWASQWIEAALRSAADRLRGSVVDWQTVLRTGLDVDAAPLGSPPEERRRGGPAAEVAAESYPWDMTEPVPFEEMTVRLRETQLTVLVQVVARAVPAALTSLDSVWVLDAVAIAARRGEIPRRRGIVLATARRVSDASLRTASNSLGLQLTEVWGQLTASDSVRAR